MPSIQPSRFLDNVMLKLRACGEFLVDQLAATHTAISTEFAERINEMEDTGNVFKCTAVPTTESQVQKSYLTGKHSLCTRLLEHI
jgi:hypothetical protein